MAITMARIVRHSQKELEVEKAGRTKMNPRQTQEHRYDLASPLWVKAVCRRPVDSDQKAEIAGIIEWAKNALAVTIV